MVKRFKRWAFRLLLLLVVTVAAFVTTALLGSFIPANSGWQEPDTGIELFIETNGVHTGLIIPMNNDIADFSDLVRPEHLRKPRNYGTHLLIGWGDAKFYRETPTWGDVRLSTALAALIGSGKTVLHVEHRYNPRAYPHYRRPLRVTRDQYAQLAKQIRADFALDDKGAPQSEFGYGEADSFYTSNGRYSMFNSCNNWTAQRLAEAGIKGPLWTPFSGGVMHWFPEEETSAND